MCAIIDANVAGEVFGSKRTEAGKKFFDWIDEGSGRLICGGKLLKELEGGSPGFREWVVIASKTGRMKNISEDDVKRRMAQIQKESIRSDDPHILALAQLSGARLLYSNDIDLREDFQNKALIDPAGSIYSTLRSKKFTPAHRNLLSRRDLCPSAQ